MSWDSWQVGADAAKRGDPPDSCPYAFTSYDAVTWYHGWAWMRHRMANEQGAQSAPGQESWRRLGEAMTGRAAPEEPLPTRRRRIRDE